VVAAVGNAGPGDARTSFAVAVATFPLFNTVQREKHGTPIVLYYPFQNCPRCTVATPKSEEIKRKPP